MYITIKEIAKKWNISERRVRKLCSEGKIQGARHEGRIWQIPNNAKKPADGRYKKHEDLLTIIEQKKHDLSLKQPLTECEIARLTQEFIVEYSYNSNAIEGNSLSLHETNIALQGLTVAKKSLQDHVAVRNHKKAFELIAQLANDKAPLSENIIKQIHYVVLENKKNDRGVYRRVPIQIMGAPYSPVPPNLIDSKMSLIIQKYTESTAHIISRLALLHIEFEAIHPFIDGNGRTGRLIVNLELLKAGYLPIDIKVTDCISYYQAFKEFHVNHNLSAMERLFASYENEKLDKYLEIV